jgi:hypothetical protein
LGASVDAEPDGQPTIPANGDGADEDGVSLPAALEFGRMTQLVVTAPQASFLDAWVDYDLNGTWDANEQVFASLPLTAGANTLAMTPSRYAAVGITYARFRLSSIGGLDPTGEAPDGEVEDYLWSIIGSPWLNAAQREDVDQDGNISPLDAILVINELTDRTYAQPPAPLPLPIPTSFPEPIPWLDVTGDRLVAPLDALLVINALPSTSASRVGGSLRDPHQGTDGSERNPHQALALPPVRLSERAAHTVDEDESPRAKSLFEV